MMAERALVAVIDDDESVRESLPDLLREFGYDVLVFSSGEEFLTSGWIDKADCLLLDIAMTGMSGPALQRELQLRQRYVPIVFITAHADETIRLRLVAEGAAQCLFKPFSDAALLAALHSALRVR